MVGWQPAPFWLGQDEAKPLTKAERDTILKMIAEGRAQLNAVEAWRARNAATFRNILGPENLAKYSQALSDAMARQRVVDALETRLAPDMPGTWLIRPSESEAQLQWGTAAQKLYEVVRPYLPKTPPPETAVVPGTGPSMKEIVAVGGVVAAVAVLVAVVA